MDAFRSDKRKFPTAATGIGFGATVRRVPADVALVPGFRPSEIGEAEFVQRAKDLA